MADPIINGFMHQWSSVEIRLDGAIFEGVKSLNYSTETDGADVMGTNSEKIGMTLGTVKHDASIELYEDDARAFLTALGDNYLTKFFDVVANYQQGNRIYTDRILGSVIKKIDDSHSEGSEALTKKFDLRPSRINRGGAGNIDLKTVVDDILSLF